jgi:hypothetical protein
MPTLALLVHVLMVAHGPIKSNAHHQYEFVEDLGIKHVMRYPTGEYTGYLDSSGQFIPDPSIPPILPKKGGTGPSRPASQSSWLLSSRPGEQLYEFRAGRLIPGVIKTNRPDTSVGAVGPGPIKVMTFFYPDIDGKIIEMSDYLKTYDPLKSRRIYNLPGRIVKKGESKK